MTEIYFVRHAEANNQNHDDERRELTEKGLVDRALVTAFLQDKAIDLVYSSPFKRAVDTLQDFAVSYGHPIVRIADFRERKISDSWIEDYAGFSQHQWHDFTFKLTGGESLQEVQARNLRALHDLLVKHRGKRIAVGSHGCSLSVLINYYDNTFGYSSFEKIRNIMPWIVKFSFAGLDLQALEMYDLAQH